MAKLMLENEKLFQRALRFADGEYKSQLEGFAQASRDKLEQERLAKEAEEEKLNQLSAKNQREAKIPDEIQSVIDRLEKLKGYKNVDELLSEAIEDLAKAKKQKLTKGKSLTAALIALIWAVLLSQEVIMMQSVQKKLNQRRMTVYRESRQFKAVMPKLSSSSKPKTISRHLRIIKFWQIRDTHLHSIS